MRAATDMGGLAPVLAVLVTAIALAWLAIAWFEARTVRIDRRTVRDPRLPQALHGSTLVFVADIHAGPIFGETRVRHLVDTINAEEPGLVILGGDYVGGYGNGAAKFYPHVGGLKAPLGVFAVLGNHDAWEGIVQARAGLEAAGIQLLENTAARIGPAGGSFVVAGLEDEWTGRPDHTDPSDTIASDEFGILVAHNPDSLVEALSESGHTWGLALAGHTHGGQVTGFYWLLPHKPSRYGARFLRGWSMEGRTPVLVSNGVGAVTVPLRFLAPPQIHVITLERAEDPGYSPR